MSASDGYDHQQGQSPRTAANALPGGQGRPHGESRMPAVKDVGEPCAGEPHARFEVAAGGNRNQSATPRGTGRLPPTLQRWTRTSLCAYPGAGCPTSRPRPPRPGCGRRFVLSRSLDAVGPRVADWICCEVAAAVIYDEEAVSSQITPNPANPKVCGTWLAELLMRAFYCQALVGEDRRLLGRPAA